MPILLKRFRAIVSLGAVVLVAAWFLRPVPAEQPGGVFPAVLDDHRPPQTPPLDATAAPAAPESVLLLRNGEMLQGQVTRCGDRYEVQVPGGEIYVRVGEVEYECRDVLEAYQRKLALIRRDSAQDRLDLCEWCIRAGLLDLARHQLDEAAALDPQHPLIPVRQRQLKVAMAPPVKPSTSKPVPVGPTMQELDRMVRGMPPKTVETFSQLIQPMLVNNCAAAACHGQSVQNGFRLFRLPSDGPPSRLLTQRNLYAALQWLDRENPEKSPLLRYATRAHGAARVAIFTDRQIMQFRQLRNWCLRVAEGDSPVVQASYNEAAGIPDQGYSRRSAGGFSRSARRARAANGMDGSPKTETLPPWDAGTIDLRTNPGADGQHRTARRGAALPKIPSSADPNDPEWFNRRFAPSARSTSGVKSPQPSQPRSATGPAANRQEGSSPETRSSSDPRS